VRNVEQPDLPMPGKSGVGRGEPSAAPVRAHRCAGGDRSSGHAVLLPGRCKSPDATGGRVRVRRPGLTPTGLPGVGNDGRSFLVDERS
jgi:hypothetical protein